MASRTVPCSSVTSCGSLTTRAPAERAWRMHWSTSGTSRLMSITPSPWARWWSSSGLSGLTPPLITKRQAPRLEHVRLVVADAGLRAGVADQLHPEGGRKKCAVWVALPTTQTTASQPMTGNWSAVSSYSTSPTSWCSWSTSRPARNSSWVSAVWVSTSVMVPWFACLDKLRNRGSLGHTFV